MEQLIERVSEDRYVLAVVLVGSLVEETIWNRDSIGMWIIEADGVSRRLRSDGNDERVFRILTEDNIISSIAKECIVPGTTAKHIGTIAAD